MSHHRSIDQRIARAIIEEATERAVRSGQHNCLIWPDRLDANGYGVSAHYGGFRAHRLAWAAAHADPGDLLVRHERCGNPSCFDHEHLAVGTDADNAADRVRMGRSNPQRAITQEVAEEAAALVNGGATVRAVARQLGIGQSTLSRHLAGMLDPSVNAARHLRKASDADVLAARLDYSNGRATMAEIRDRLGMSWPAVWKMIRGETYRHVGFAHSGEAVVIERPMLCSVPGCDREVLARGWCTAHYNRWKAHGDVHADIPLRPPRGGGHAPRTLTEDDVRSIRHRHANGEKVAHIARDLGVAHGTVKAVVDRRTWAHVPDGEP